MLNFNDNSQIFSNLKAEKTSSIYRDLGLKNSKQEEIICFKGKSDLVPTRKNNYCFMPDLSEAILKTLNHSLRMFIHGMHGSGKTTHIEQIAARLNWPVIRMNLDNEINRVELIGRDVLVEKNGKTEMQFQLGLLSFAVSNPVILILDEYDAASSETLFILQQLLEENGKLVLPETSQIITPHKYFRIFATANTAGFGDEENLYFGTNNLNQGQLDRWQIIHKIDYLDKKTETKLINKEFPQLDKNLLKTFIQFTELVRNAFKNGNLSNSISTRALLNLVQNYCIFSDLEKALRYSVIYRFPKDEYEILGEFCQRVFAIEIADLNA